MCILTCQVLWYFPLTGPFSHWAKEWVPVRGTKAVPWGTEELPPGSDPWPGYWLRSGSCQKEEECGHIKGGRDFPKKKHQMHKDSYGKIICPAFTFRIYHFLSSFSIYTGHELGSYEIISEQCRSTLLPQTLIYEICTHKQMERFYHFSINDLIFRWIPWE